MYELKYVTLKSYRVIKNEINILMVYDSIHTKIYMHIMHTIVLPYR